jgi:tetratricopeptide (TPR) repeat protein
VTVLAVLVASVGWVWHDTEARRAEAMGRQAEIDRAAVTDLEEATRHMKGDSLPEAMQALQRADGRMAAGGSAYVAERLERTKRDVSMVHRLEQARMLASSHPSIEQNLSGGDRAYLTAFADYGLDPEALPAAEAAIPVRDSQICRQLVMALDEWSFIRERLHPGSGKALQAIARLADDDPLRQRLRDLLAREDVDSLERFAKEKAALDLPPAYLILLGQTLADRGRGSGDLWRRAQRRYPGSFWINACLGASMIARSQGNQAALMETAGYLRVALALRPGSPHTQLLLARTLALAQQWTDAENAYGGAYLATVGIFPQAAIVQYELGDVLRIQGKLKEAETAYRKAIELKPDQSEWFCKLGLMLVSEERFAEALPLLRRGNELGSRDPKWPYPTAASVEFCERLLRLESKLPLLLSGKEQPVDHADRVALAEFCSSHRNSHAAAARFYAEAFAEEPALTSDPRLGRLYSAACDAALAGCRQGNDTAHLGEQDCVHFRRQALEWLRADLTAVGRLLVAEPDKARRLIQERRQMGLADTDFAGVRDDALAKLPAAERQAWQQLWADVADVVGRAQKKSTPVK